MFESNLANLTAQYQQAYLVYCYKVMQYLQAYAWLAEQHKAQKQAQIKQVKEKTASGVKKLAPEPNQQNHDFKSLIHQEKSNLTKKLPQMLHNGTFGGNGNGLGVQANPHPQQQSGFWDAVGGTASGMLSNMGNDLMNSADSFNNAFIFPATDLMGKAGDRLDPFINTAATMGPWGKGVSGAGMIAGKLLKGAGKARGLFGKAGKLNSLPANKYERGFVREFVTETDQSFYRVFSNIKEGKWLTANKPNSKAFALESLSLPRANKANLIQRVNVPAGTNMRRSRAGGFDAHNIFPNRRGGAEQFKLLERIPPKSFKDGVPFE